MATIPQNKRPQATIQNVEDFLYELGPVRNNEVLFKQLTFSISWGGSGITIELEHPGNMTALNRFKEGIFRELKGNFNGLVEVKDKQGFKRLQYTRAREYFVDFDVDDTEVKFRGTIPAYIHEEGTTYMLNAALQDNVKFEEFKKGKEKHILANGQPIENHDVYRKLMKLFGPKFNFRLPKWIWTFYQQQKAWLKEYGKPAWEPFIYGPGDFVKYFTKHMKDMKRESGQDAGDYTTWNPSDIWAVRGMTKVRNDLDQQLKRGSLIEMNNILINLLEDEELVGISLKMVAAGQDAHLHLHNVEISPILRDLTSFSQIEEYDMSDISFRYNNIWEGEASTALTQVKIGPGNKYEINIGRSGNIIGFNTKVAGAAAQAGQTPTWMVQDWLKAIKLPDGKSFSKGRMDYPQDFDALKAETLKYQEMYNFITEGQRAPSYVDFEYYMEGFYKKNSRTAVVKMMLLTFWYVALTGFGNENTNVRPYRKSAEFWTDLLYTGMKIKPGREFAPHAKIS